MSQVEGVVLASHVLLASNGRCAPSMLFPSKFYLFIVCSSVCAVPCVQSGCSSASLLLSRARPPRGHPTTHPPESLAGGRAVVLYFLGGAQFCNIRQRSWCLLFVLIQQGHRGGPGPQRLTGALWRETGNPIMTLNHSQAFSLLLRGRPTALPPKSLAGGGPVP